MSTALVASALVLDGAGRWRLAAPVDVSARPIKADGAAIERGRHLGESVLVCTECHGPDLGGKVVTDSPGFGRIIGPNLTSGRGGVGATMGELDWDRVVRHGVASDGRPLVLMPADGYAFLPDADVAALRAWVEQVPPVDRELPPTALGPVGRVLALVGKVHVAAWMIDHAAAPSAPGAQPMHEGEQLARVSGCFGCHGEDLRGRAIQPGRPPAPALVSGPVAEWTEQEFASALRTGRRPDGSELDPLMPWRGFAGLSDAEVHTLWDFLAKRRASEAPPTPDADIH